MMHDLLVISRDGIKKTPIMSALQMGYKPLMRLLKNAKTAGFIEEIEATGEQKRWKNRSTMIWKTTNKGFEWARRVWEDHLLVVGTESDI